MDPDPNTSGTNKDESAWQSSSAWTRGLYMLIFLIAFEIGETVLFFCALVQFFWVLFTRQPNQFLARFGVSMAAWIGDVVRFLTCVTDDKPFPWKPWPQPPGGAPE